MAQDGNSWYESVRRVKLGGRLSNEAAEVPRTPQPAVKQPSSTPASTAEDDWETL